MSDVGGACLLYRNFVLKQLGNNAFPNLHIRFVQ